MREFDAGALVGKIKKALIDMAYFLPADVEKSLKNSYEAEKWTIAKTTLSQILQNADIARNTSSPICQDTGMVVAFVTIGQDVHVVNGSLTDSINEGASGIQRRLFTQVGCCRPCRRTCKHQG